MSRLEVLPGAPNEIVWRRVFDAPRHLVLRAMTEPALIQRWLGGVRAEVLKVEVDHRVGGAYRYWLRTAAGHEFSFGGVFVAISGDQIVQTEKFDEFPTASTVTSTFTEAGGKTTLHVVIAFETAEIRDAVARTGMSTGAGESYDALADLLARL